MAGDRRMLVLRAVVEDYIRSQEPVGSAALARKHDLGVSSATIRNDMAALEEEGYLIQPHVSAGRVPTEKGYRYFVDRLSTVVPLSLAQRRAVERFLSGSVSLEDALRRAARLLSRITGQVAVVASPSMARSRLRHVELVTVGPGTLLAVIISDTGQVTQRTLQISPMPSEERLGELTDRVNAEACGRSPSAAASAVRALATGAYRDMAVPVGMLADALGSLADGERSGELYVSGASRLAHGSPAADLAPLFDALEEQVVIMRLMSELSEDAPGADGVGVAIGSETHTPGLLHASVVSGGYGHADGGDDGRGRDAAGEPVAFVGSIGPTHMDYAATMAAVRAVARYLTAMLAHGGGD